MCQIVFGKLFLLYIVWLKVAERINDIENFVQRSWFHDSSGNVLSLSLIVGHSYDIDQKVQRSLKILSNFSVISRFAGLRFIILLISHFILINQSFWYKYWSNCVSLPHGYRFAYRINSKFPKIAASLSSTFSFQLKSITANIYFYFSHSFKIVYHCLHWCPAN